MLVQDNRPGPGSTVSWIRPGRTLLVASTGGHLEELHRLRSRFVPTLAEVEWVTFDTPQSRELLAGERVHFIPFVHPRDARGALHAGRVAAKLLATGRFSRVVSTGAAVAVPFLGRARSLGLAGHYIESAARCDGLSLSGSMISRLPGVRLYGQYPGWTSGRWQYRGSVFDEFTSAEDRTGATIDKVVVTVGTQRGFDFRRALERLVGLLPEVCTSSPTVLWQTGCTSTTGLAIRPVTEVPGHVLAEAVGEADLVISHSGVGTALLSLEHGKCPTLLPRRRDRGEHADDHQQLLAMELSRRDLAVWADASEVSAADLVRASRMRAVRSQPPSFTLQPD